MKLVKLIFVILVVATMAGCASVTPNFSVKQDFWQNKRGTVGIAIAKLPKPDAVKAGSQGLLDIAINDANASDLVKALKKVDITTIKQLSAHIAAYLLGKGYQVEQFATPIDVKGLPDVKDQPKAAKGIIYAKKNFQSLKSSLGVDKLLLISVNNVGTIRSYYGFIPLGAPSGYASITGKVIDLSNNQLEWNQVVTQTVAHGSGKWDTPPNFVSLTNAMKLAYSQAQGVLFNDFTQ